MKTNPMILQLSFMPFLLPSREMYVGRPVRTGRRVHNPFNLPTPTLITPRTHTHTHTTHTRILLVPVYIILCAPTPTHLSLSLSQLHSPSTLPQPSFNFTFVLFLPSFFSSLLLPHPPEKNKHHMAYPSILIIGASGRLGTQLIRATNKFSPRPYVHAFVRDPTKVESVDRKLCHSIQPGDATIAGDISAALRATKANVIIVSIGNNDVKPTNVRGDCARAIMDVIHPGSSYAHVQVIVISSVGCGGTHINIGLCLGTLLTHKLRHVLKDHDDQEHEFITRMGRDNKQRLLIIRPTALENGKGTGRVAIFEKRPVPAGRIYRKDLAEWIINELCTGRPNFGRQISITGDKGQQRWSRQFVQLTTDDE